ncbi:2-phospho-L-lactate guanylyltransferase [Microbacterium lushaniae]|uniref:Phosphoenolpyruvate guanylyltransferase n=1 Tax=Microbacterium lushaniae TaxID=2614639 RepID=A0A5J6L7R7_9MICO|nr:2-phospho-L-lactate guanylyltransferase [Microbacterium lushaniae]QEW04460.1 2-phospho-L-lactate guanylyltransferase [Microbacterium lushaniae]
MTPNPPLEPVTSANEPEYGADGWVVIVPVKPATVGKTRLADAAVDRAALARAIALDTIAAAAGATRVARVVVVTDDQELIRAATGTPRVEIVREVDAAGLDAAIALGAQAAGQGAPRAALLGDLPALRSVDLDAALGAAGSVERGLVPDAEGTGSTLVTARPGAVWTTAFGEDSAARHRLLGCTDLDVPEDSTLRRDVDTPAQLAAAEALGLGPRTAALLSAAPVA